jgi:CBS domain-containing protein
MNLQDLIAAKAPRELVWVAASASVAEAVALMAQAEIGAVLVKTEDALPGGIFTERDLLVRVVHAGLDPACTPVSLVMTREPRFVTPQTRVDEALALMLRERHRHLLVIDGPREHGLLSMRDLSQHLLAQVAAAGASPA